MKAAVLLTIVVTCAIHASTTHAATVNRCLARKIDNVGASIAARTRCYAKDAAEPDAGALNACLSTAAARFKGRGVPSKGAFESAERYPPCVTQDDQAPFDDAIAGFVASLDVAIGNPGVPSRCDMAKLKCVGKYVLAMTRCHAKGAASGVVDAGCVGAAALRLSNGVNGCLDKVETRGGCTITGDLALLEAAADRFVADALCALDPVGSDTCNPTPPTPTPAPERTPTRTPSKTPTPSQTAAGGDAAQLCVDTINQYRASIGRPPYARWTAAETCANEEALADGRAQTPHSAFNQCGELGQNECIGFGTPSRLIVRCLELMWNEGPGQGAAHGHYNAMASTGYTKVACGFATLPNGEVWATQDFR